MRFNGSLPHSFGAFSLKQCRKFYKKKTSHIPCKTIPSCFYSLFLVFSLIFYILDIFPQFLFVWVLRIQFVESLLFFPCAPLSSDRFGVQWRKVAERVMPRLLFSNRKENFESTTVFFVHAANNWEDVLLCHWMH